MAPTGISNSPTVRNCGSWRTRSPMRLSDAPLRPSGIRTCRQMPAAITAAAHWTAATQLAPPIGVVAERRRSGMPKLVTKSSATTPLTAYAMMPSMSLGVSPASAIAASDARIWSAITLWPEFRLYAVSPTPVTAALSLSDMSSSIDALHSRHRGERLQLLAEPADGVEEQMIGAQAHQLLQLLAHLGRRAVDARGVGAVGVPIHDAEPAVHLFARHVGPIVHRQEHALG